VYLDPRLGLSLSDFGQLSLAARIGGNGVTAANQWVLLGNDGDEVLARTAQTVPSGQRNGAGSITFFPLAEFVHGPQSSLTSFSRDGEGRVLGVGGRIEASQTFPAPGGVDSAAMFSDPERGGLTVAVQENCEIGVIAGSPRAGDGAPIALCYVDASGARVVLAREQRATPAGRSVIVNEAHVVSSGEEVIAGSGERWSRVRFDDAFAGVAARPNAAGTGTDVLIAGYTDQADALRDGVLALNAMHVLLREGDAIDVNADGRFDGEDACVAGFAPGSVVLSATHATVLVTLRSFASSIGCAADSIVGEAIVSIARPDAAGFECPADFNQDGGVDGGDVEAFFEAWAVAMPRADVNQDGGVDGADVEFFFTVWTAGGC
jgi:hypothetical protein